MRDKELWKNYNEILERPFSDHLDNGIKDFYANHKLERDNPVGAKNKKLIANRPAMILQTLIHALHPLILMILKSKVVHQMHLLNEKPEIKGNAIYVANHGSMHDTPYSGLVIQNHVWIVAGKQRLTLLDRIFFILNGSVWIDRKSKDSKVKGSKRMLELLQKGENIFMFPEGTWNTIPSVPMMPMAWGVIELAMQSGCPIVPFALEYFGDDCYVKWGEPFYCNPLEDKGEKIKKLRDAMATLRWEIWEGLPVTSRKDISSTEWEEEIQARVSAYPPLDFEYEQSCIRREKGVVSPEEAFAYRRNL